MFMEKDGRMLTPPVECGLLPGVYRRHLLETRPDMEERVLMLEDLRRRTRFISAMQFAASARYD